MRHSSTDWAAGEPKPGGGNCVEAVRSLGYKWRAASCGEFNPFLCAFRRPKCPVGYEYDYTVSPSGTLASSSCYKVTRPASYEQGDDKYVCNLS